MLICTQLGSSVRFSDVPAPLPPIKSQAPQPSHDPGGSDTVAGRRVLTIVGGTIAVLLIGLVVGGLAGSQLGNEGVATVTVTAKSDGAGSTSGAQGGTSGSEGVSKPSNSGLSIGSTGNVAGLFGITLDSFDRRSASGDSVIYRATMTVKNLGSETVGPFCGGSGAILLDSQGRKFEGESVLSSSSVNCGPDGDIGPGLSEGPYLMDFELPSDAQPSELKLFGGYEYEDDAAVWKVS